jgi:hypothetical protein
MLCPIAEGSKKAHNFGGSHQSHRRLLDEYKEIVPEHFLHGLSPKRNRASDRLDSKSKVVKSSCTQIESYGEHNVHVGKLFSKGSLGESMTYALFHH